jgi:methylthioribose-1-phosphate isomerase
MSKLADICAYLASARPTAVNLSWALNRMQKRARACASAAGALAALKEEAIAIRDEDVSACRAIGRHGLALLRNGDAVLTHCNAGRLAAVKYGTATAPLYLGAEAGLTFKVYVDETRPLLQGARLTAFELKAAGFDVTLICDNMAASLMQQNLIQAVLVGCDRVAANGDAANKIGTLPLAIVARRYKVPVYFCAPSSSIDVSCAVGEDIVIEQRDGSEISEMWYREPMAPAGCVSYNPAFDVTEHELITAFVTEYGLAYPPFGRSLAAIMQAREQGQ